MTLFGLDEAAVMPSITRVRGELADDVDALRDCVARAAWHVIAEPGDGVAGTLIGAVGAAAALTALLAGSAPRTIARMVEDTLGPSDGGLAERLDAGIQRWRPRLLSRDVVHAFELAARVTATLVLPGDDAWPTRMDDLGDHAPILLWWRGQLDPSTATGRAIAIVGSRAATGYGEHVAAELAGGLVERGVSVVSGAAYGIDGMAHRAALATHGNTVAYLAGGVDRFYPSGNSDLLTRIVARGAVVSEVPCGTAPTKWRFLSRNLGMACICGPFETRQAILSHASKRGRSCGGISADQRRREHDRASD